MEWTDGHAVRFRGKGGCRGFEHQLLPDANTGGAGRTVDGAAGVDPGPFPPRYPLPMDLPEIDPAAAAAELEGGEAVFVDVRRPGDHVVARIPGSVNPSDATIEDFVEDTAKDQRLIVYCYHGHMSLGGVAFFQEKGFTDVASLRGGFEDWRRQFPIEEGAPKDAS